jgi:hypothetical protein
MSWRKGFSWLFKSKFLFEKFSFFCWLYPIMDLHSMVFKPVKLHVYPWKRLMLLKTDFGCPEKTGLSGFCGFKPPGQNLPFHHFSHFSLSHIRATVWVTPRPPLVIHWFLRGILEFLGEVNSPRTGVSVLPAVFSHLKVFSPNPRSLCPMDGFEISLVHCLSSCHRSIPCNISKFSWLNRSDSWPRVESAETGVSGLQNRMFRFW